MTANVVHVSSDNRRSTAVRRADRGTGLLVAAVTVPLSYPGRSGPLPVAAVVVLIPALTGLTLLLAWAWCGTLTDGLLAARIPNSHVTTALAEQERQVLTVAVTWTAGLVLTAPVPLSWTPLWFGGGVLSLAYAAAPRRRRDPTTGRGHLSVVPDA